VRARYKQLTCPEEISDSDKAKILAGSAAILFNLGQGSPVQFAFELTRT